MAAKHPKFVRQNRAVDKRVGEAWRKPHGIDNKQRVKLRWAGAMPNIGYRGKKEERGKRLGKFLVVVHNAAEAAKCNPKTTDVYISATVGKKKRVEIIEAAKKASVHVLNPGKKVILKTGAAKKPVEAKQESKK